MSLQPHVQPGKRAVADQPADQLRVLIFLLAQQQSRPPRGASTAAPVCGGWRTGHLAPVPPPCTSQPHLQLSTGPHARETQEHKHNNSIEDIQNAPSAARTCQCSRTSSATKAHNLVLAVMKIRPCTWMCCRVGLCKPDLGKMSTHTGTGTTSKFHTLHTRQLKCIEHC